LYSCNNPSNDCTDVDYSNCNTNEPEVGNMNIKLTINNENTEVPISVYKGKYEDGVLVTSDTATSSKFVLSLPVNEYYSVTARYKSGDKIIFALDGDKIKKKKNILCDSTCWSVIDGNVNLKLSK